MKDAHLFDPKQHHGEISEIKTHMNLSPLAPETWARQQAMLEFWNQEMAFFRSRVYQERAALEVWQLKRLQFIVDWAFSNSPFYQERFKAVGYELGGIRSFSDFSKLPTLTKREVVEYFDRGMVSTNTNLSECRWMSSSGSSGTKVQIVLPQERANLDTLIKYRMFEQMMGAPLDPKRWLYNIHFCLWWHTSFLGQYPVFSVTQNCSAQAVAKHLKLLRPQVVSSIGSYLEELALEKVNLYELGIKVASTNSETTTRAERERWSEVFGVPVLDEYSSEELDIIAQECPARSYHVVEDDCFVEIINQDRLGIGEIVGTDLWNTALPMIRYRQGDLGEWEQEDDRCSCRSQFRRIHNFHGRADQAFVSQNAKRIPPGQLLDAVEHVFCRDDSNIAQFRVIQQDFAAVDVLLVTQDKTPTYPVWVRTEFEGRLESLFEHSVLLRVFTVAKLPEEKSYKRRSLISKVAQGGAAI